MSNKDEGGWIGVDFDATLAVYDRNFSPTEFGEPIAPMVERVRKWLEDGVRVKVMTARVSGTPLTHEAIGAVIAHRAKYGDVVTWDEAVAEIKHWNSLVPEIERAIKQWCLLHIGQELEVTCQKDFQMIELWDDRCVRVMPNTGMRCCDVE